MPAVDPRQYFDAKDLTKIDPGHKYLDAKAKLDSAEKAVTNLVSCLDQVVNALRKDPWSFSVSNVKVSFPTEAVMGGYSLNGDEWPSAQQIAETLATLHQARKEVTSAWASLSPADRSNLPPPPGAD